MPARLTHKNNISHRVFPHYTQLVPCEVRKELAVVCMDEVNAVSFLCQKAGKSIADVSSPQDYWRSADVEQPGGTSFGFTRAFKMKSCATFKANENKKLVLAFVFTYTQVMVPKIF